MAEPILTLTKKVSEELVSTCILGQLPSIYKELLCVAGKAKSVDAFVDIDTGRITIVDDGEGILPDMLLLIQKSTDYRTGTQEKSLFSLSGSFLRSLGHFSHLTICSRHHTFRQAYTLSLSPSTTPAPPCPSSTRSAIGTTVTVKDLFANYPVRRASSQSNITAQWIELQTVTLGIGLSCSVAITLRNRSGEKIVNLGRSEESGWERSVLERGLGGKCCLYIEIGEEQAGVGITMKVFFGNTPRSFTFTYVNGRYVHTHSLVTELKPALSKITASITSSHHLPSESYKSVIIILRITSHPQPCLSLAQTIVSLLENLGITRGQPFIFKPGVLARDAPRQDESKIVSARGIEYSKVKRRRRKQEFEMTVGREEPGIEFQQKFGNRASGQVEQYQRPHLNILPHRPKPTKKSSWINPVYSSIEQPIPLLETISTKQSISLSSQEFLTATIINQVDRKFILISIPHFTTSTPLSTSADKYGAVIQQTLAVIDQHAADERYRLEQLTEQLPQKTYRLNPAIEIPLSDRIGKVLWKRRGVLLRWGVDITIEKPEMGTSERLQGTLKELGAVGRLQGVPEITKDLNATKWKEILLQYTSEEASQPPSLLTEILASKACRSLKFGMRFRPDIGA